MQSRAAMAESLAVQFGAALKALTEKERAVSNAAKAYAANPTARTAGGLKSALLNITSKALSCAAMLDGVEQAREEESE